MSQFIFWPCLSGIVFLAIGLFAVRTELKAALGLDKLLVLARLFVATPLAVFGAEHLAGAQFIMQAVPAWMPARMFLTYFVGLALVAAALSLIFMKYVPASSTLLGVMFVLFVLMIHLPNVAANPRDRILWAVALRDLSFAGGAFALAGTQIQHWNESISKALIRIARGFVALPLLFFAVEHILHPQFAPGVPLPKLTPTGVPFPHVLATIVAAALFVAGVCLLIGKRARTTTTWLGLVLVLLTFFFYLPILALARQPAQITEGLNYVADTMLFAGMVLFLAAAMPAAAMPPAAAMSNDKPDPASQAKLGHR